MVMAGDARDASPKVRQILDAVLRYEDGEGARPGEPIAQPVLVESYLDALAWTTETTAAVRRP